jgi:LPXTG-motif cell wall-anchored protein
MEQHLRAILATLVAAPIALAAAVAFASPAPDVKADRVAVNESAPVPTVSDPSLTPSPSAMVAGPSASASIAANAAAAMPRTNLTAVFDPIAVPVSNGYRIRVGVRNSGPRSINAPTAQPAARFQLDILATGPVTSLGGCEYVPELPPSPPYPARWAYFLCRSGSTLRTGQTYWESFDFPSLTYFEYTVRVTASGYADDPDPSDNTCKVKVRAGQPGPGLPVTGSTPISVAGIGAALILTGAAVLWVGRRRRLMRSTKSALAVE